MSNDTRLIKEKKLLKYLADQSTSDPTLRSLLKNIEYKVRPLFDLSTTIITTSRNLFIGPSKIQNPDTLRNRSVAPLKGVLMNFSGGSITLPSASSNNIIGGQSAVATITILDYTKLTTGGNDTFDINSVTFTATTASSGVATFRAVTSNEQTAINFAECINDTNSIFNTIYAEAIGSVVYLRSKVGGTASNSIPLTYTDNGTTGGASISGATFTGGTDMTPVSLVISNSNYRKMFIMIDGTGSLSVSLGTEGSTVALATTPAQAASTTLIGMYVIYCNGSGVVSTISKDQMYELDNASYDQKHASLDSLQSDDHNTIYSRNPIITAQSAGTLSVTGSVTRDTFYICDTSGGAITVNLAAISGFASGFRLQLIKTTADVNTVTINANGAELINGSSSFVLSTQYSAVILTRNATGWTAVATSSSSTEFTTLLLDQTTTPSNPAANKDLLYAKSDDLLYTLTSAGTESVILSNANRPVLEQAPYFLNNISVTTSVGSNAMTITVKAADGSSLSATNFATINFHSSTASNGTVVRRTITSDLTFTITADATLGIASGVETPFYLYAVDTGSGIVLGVCRLQLNDNEIYSSTAIAASSDFNNILYTTSAQSSKPIRLIAKIISTQSTAGAWASNASKIYIANRGIEQEKIVAVYSTAAGQSINTSTWSIVNMGTKNIDTHNAVTTGVNWQFISPDARKYKVSAHSLFQTATFAAGNSVFCTIEKNNSGTTGQITSLSFGHTAIDSATSNYRAAIIPFIIVDLAAGDYIDFRVWQDSGGARSLIASAPYNQITIESV
jgi:hypothetical protein